MIREVDLVSYLPHFIVEFKEITTTLTAEDPEFMLVWDAAERVLKNEFIETADEYGISRFEKMLNIFPEPYDTLDIRRTRIMTRWFVALPYTIRTLIKKLISLCGENNFIVTTDFDHYRIKVETRFEFVGQIQEVETLLERMVPANIVIDMVNRFLPVSLFTDNRFIFKDLKIALAVQNRSSVCEGIQLNGEKTLDGTWRLNSVRPGMQFPAFRVGIILPKNMGAYTPKSLNITGCSVQNAFTASGYSQIGVNVVQKENLLQGTMAIKGLSAGQSFDLSGSVLMDGRWTLDGDYILNGSRRLNQIYSEEVL